MPEPTDEEKVIKYVTKILSQDQAVKAKLQGAELKNVVTDFVKPLTADSKKFLSQLESLRSVTGADIPGRNVASLSADIAKAIVENDSLKKAYAQYLAQNEMKKYESKHKGKSPVSALEPEGSLVRKTSRIGPSIDILMNKDLTLEQKLNVSKKFNLSATALQSTINAIEGSYTENQQTNIAALSLGIMAKVVGVDSPIKTRTLYQKSLKELRTLPPEVTANIMQASAAIIKKPENEEITPDSAIAMGKSIGKQLRADLEAEKKVNPTKEPVPSIESILAKEALIPRLNARLIGEGLNPTAEPRRTTSRIRSKGHGIK